MDTPTVTVADTGTPYRMEISDGGHRWFADEPQAVGGGDSAPTPMHLLCSSLGACTAITLRMYAARKQWPLESLEVKVTMNPEGKPEDGSTLLVRRITLHGGLDQEQRSRLLQIANACPTHKILSGSIEIDSALI
ncbi:OsmC family protein [Alloalcanivorax mobilis]|uniref:OsmC family protein n=1 Tax=Alloalcanivorax mobilis TaxID=2019569 RepID=UPI000C779B31|nr:OsmC family protein [Alloalcanivorax mobilis]|tara:strand:+ start:65722 stop:66126 length:405 start_codon:yes stop_codon:yes gene_type:complete